MNFFICFRWNIWLTKLKSGGQRLRKKVMFSSSSEVFTIIAYRLFKYKRSFTYFLLFLHPPLFCPTGNPLLDLLFNLVLGLRAHLWEVFQNITKWWLTKTPHGIFISFSFIIIINLLYRSFPPQSYWKIEILHFELKINLPSKYIIYRFQGLLNG